MDQTFTHPAKSKKTHLSGFAVDHFLLFVIVALGFFGLSATLGDKLSHPNKASKSLGDQVVELPIDDLSELASTASLSW